jgi:O-antigen/teichoic acid export membrane protein
VAPLIKNLRSLIKHRLARNAAWMLFGQGANILLQAGCFILLARLLGATEYGIFAGAFALVNIVSPYSSLGANMLFMRYVSADRSMAAVYWGNALIVTATVSAATAVAFFFAGPALTHIRSGMIFVVLAFANCLLGQISSLASTVFQTFEKMGSTAALIFLSNCARFLILLAMLATLHHASAVEWSFGVLGASACAGLLSLLWVRREIGAISFDMKLVVSRIWEGLGFSFAGSTQSVYNDVDKTMLSHYGLNRENGFYSLAYRIVDFSTAPILALESAVLPRYFRLGHESLRAVVKLAANSALVAALLGVVIAGSTLLVAPVVPHIVGRDFSGVLVALRWLCWLPLFRGIHRFTGGALTGSGHQRVRTAAQLAVAVINFFLNLWWIPVHGWIGAAWSSVASDGLLALFNALLLLWLSKQVSYIKAPA